MVVRHAVERGLKRSNEREIHSDHVAGIKRKRRFVGDASTVLLGSARGGVAKIAYSTPSGTKT